MNLKFRVGVSALAAMLPSLVMAQASVPTTPRECVEELRAYRMAEIFARGYFDAPYIPKDTIEMKVSVKANDCIARFPVADVSGKQIDALASIYVLSGQDDKGKELFAKRFADPNLKGREKSLAYLAGVKAFSDHNKPARIATAEEYMKALDALPAADAAEEIIGAHAIMANTYRLLEKYDDQIRHGMASLTVAQKATQFDRAANLDPLISTYGDLAETYVARPDGKARIDEIAKIFSTPVAPDPADVKEGVDKAVQRGYMLGKPAPDIVANHWFNMDQPPANNTMIVKGNVPHVLEFTQFG